MLWHVQINDSRILHVMCTFSVSKLCHFQSVRIADLEIRCNQPKPLFEARSYLKVI